MDTQCYLPMDIFPKLPHIFFRMEKGGETVQLDLTDLVMEFSQNRRVDKDVTLLRNDRAIDNIRRMCLVRGGPSYDKNGNHLFSPIIFGNRALRHIYTVFDSRNSNGVRVGMANRYLEGSQPDVQCRSKIKCEGMQTRKADNTCKNPVCDRYFFLEFQTEDKTCTFSPKFHLFAGMLITVVVVVEFVMNYLHESISKKVRDAIVPIDVPANNVELQELHGSSSIGGDGEPVGVEDSSAAAGLDGEDNG
mmetsp:Transcript_305/g.457  ORF Transcript_305/g.457 Transcript_305/m.457 type:complete len:248 (+) Transcript_305:148-891(+)